MTIGSHRFSFIQAARRIIEVPRDVRRENQQLSSKGEVIGIERYRVIMSCCIR